MTDWTQRVATLKPGDTVAYSRQWLRATGQMTGDLPQARGTIESIEHLGSLPLARIKWDEHDILERVNVKNLSPIKDGAMIERDRGLHYRRRKFCVNPGTCRQTLSFAPGAHKVAEKMHSDNHNPDDGHWASDSKFKTTNGPDAAHRSENTCQAFS